MSVLHKLSLKSIGALGIVLDCDYCLWLHVSVLARSLGHVGDASGEGSIEFIFNWAYHVRVRIGGLESKIVHWSLQYVGLCKLVFLVIIEINILNYQVIIIILIIELLHVIIFDRFEVMFYYLRTDSLLLPILQRLIYQR